MFVFKAAVVTGVDNTMKKSIDIRIFIMKKSMQSVVTRVTTPVVIRF